MTKSRSYIRIVSPVLIRILSFNDPSVTAMAYWPFVIYRKLDYPNIQTIENHELIHHRQQLEMLVLPYHLTYFVHFIYNLLRYRQYKKAYRNVCFEREAYANETNSDYLKVRRFWSWIKYL